MYTSYDLTLADGSCWRLTNGNSNAVEIVELLAKTMMLRPTQAEGRKLRIIKDKLLQGVYKVDLDGSWDISITVSSSIQSHVFPMRLISSVIFRDILTRGGLLIHGALAEIHGNGIVLAGPSNVGKSTASQRLPRPWKSLSDDTCLVVRDEEGCYWVHPWPTWSRLYKGGPGGIWDVQKALPLKAIFFLKQSPKDKVEKIYVSQATSMLIESVQQVSWDTFRYLSVDEIHAIYAEQVAASELLAKAIPANMLYISLEGDFWEELENVLSHDIFLSNIQPTRKGDDSSIPVAFTGNSMNPTLRAGDLLMVKPYGDKFVKKGDVIYLRQNDHRDNVVHRVIRATKEGVMTRGDNNPSNDPHLLNIEDIVGMVVSAQRGGKIRRVHGGRVGLLVMRKNRAAKFIISTSVRALRKPYRIIKDSGILLGLLPPIFKPKVVW